MRRTVLISLAVAVGACTAAEPPATSVPPPTATSAIQVTTITSTPAPPSICSGEASGFIIDGARTTISGPAGDAAVLTGIDIAADGDCERLTVAMATQGGAPAVAVGGVDLELRGGVLRITLPAAVTSTAFASLTLDADRIARVYVARIEPDRLRLDVHLASSGPVRVTLLETPARLVVEAAPGTALADRPVYGVNAAIVGPAPGPAGYPLTVEGYVRTRADSTTIVLAGADGDRLEETISGLDYPWQAFRVQFPAGPTGSVQLQVEDVEVPLLIQGP